MQKDFNRWNETKKSIDWRTTSFFCHQREIWWCSLGLNIGSEEDGKNELFERPVLILKVFNKNIIRVVPLTSRLVNDKNHIVINYSDKRSSIKLSRLKTISTKRLTRKLDRLDSQQFKKVIEILKLSIA